MEGDRTEDLVNFELVLLGHLVECLLDLVVDAESGSQVVMRLENNLAVVEDELGLKLVYNPIDQLVVEQQFQLD